jgi:hypothetical protein
LWDLILQLFQLSLQHKNTEPYAVSLAHLLQSVLSSTLCNTTFVTDRCKEERETAEATVVQNYDPKGWFTCKRMNQHRKIHHKIFLKINEYIKNRYFFLTFNLAHSQTLYCLS